MDIRQFGRPSGGGGAHGVTVPTIARALWSAVAERNGDTAFARTRQVVNAAPLVRSKAPSPLRFAGAVQSRRGLPPEGRHSCRPEAWLGDKSVALPPVAATRREHQQALVNADDLPDAPAW